MSSCRKRFTLSLQGLHSVAYQGALGRPLIAPPGAASRLTPDDLAQFVSEHYTGANMALAGAELLPSLLAGGSPAPPCRCSR